MERRRGLIIDFVYLTTIFFPLHDKLNIPSASSLLVSSFVTYKKISVVHREFEASMTIALVYAFRSTFSAVV